MFFPGLRLHNAVLCVVTCFFLHCHGSSQKTLTGEVSTYRTGSVTCQKRQCIFHPDVLDWQSATAVGSFNDTLLTTGWGILDISAGHAENRTSSNLDIMYAAGFLEGVFTARQIDSHSTNLKRDLLGDRTKDVIEKLKQWFINQREWADQMVLKYRKSDALWRHMGYILAQLDGLYAGYKSVSPNNATSEKDPVDKFTFNFLNAAGDLGEILEVLDPSSAPNWSNLTEDESLHAIRSKGHCSALIKLLPGFENIFMSHSTWFEYAATNRIFKHYDFNVNDSFTAAKRLSFSSYPGNLESVDDFYMLGSGMVMLQTSIGIFDEALYKKVTKKALLAWQRVRLANMMADSGEEWTEILGRYNSGTYNNEYMVVDLKKFKPFQPLSNGTLWVADQIPGLVAAADSTDILRDGYFPSYNIPFLEEVYIKSGYAAFAKSHGPGSSYDLASRAKIFRRDQGKVASFDDMKKLMRYNDYLHDPYSKGKPSETICSRGDLEKEDPSAGGCFDTKVTDFSMAMKLQAQIINGPTLGTGLPAFTWKGKFSDTSHLGLPPVYNFSFVETQPHFRG